MKTLLASALVTMLPVAAFASPPLDVPADRLDAAVHCDGDPRTSARIPLLLVHGTGVTAKENWSVGYQQALRARGHAVCTVDMPDHAYGDVQVNVQYVAHATRAVGRRMPVPLDHILMAGDAVAFALVLDALDHPGPVSPGRVAVSCSQLFFEQVDVVGFLLEAPSIATRQGTPTTSAPATRCYLLPSCASVTERGRMLGKVRVIKKRVVTVVLQVETAGQVRVRVGRRVKVRSFEPGAHRITFPRKGKVAVFTKPRYYDVWARER